MWGPEGATGVMEPRRLVAGVALNSEGQSNHQVEWGIHGLDRMLPGLSRGPQLCLGLGLGPPPGLRQC